MSRAACLPGRALHVALALWFVSGLTKSRTVKPSKDRWELFGVTRDTCTSGLLALERAGLVTVERLTGRRPVICILDTPSSE